MTERILRLDDDTATPPPPDRPPIFKWLVLGLAIAVVFGTTVVIILQMMPSPHSPSDYLIAGGLATMVSMLVFFVVYVTSVMRSPGTFFERRPPSKPRDSSS